jgi:hypothetical protein
MYTWNAYAKERANFEEKEELYKKKRFCVVDIILMS